MNNGVTNILIILPLSWLALRPVDALALQTNGTVVSVSFASAVSPPVYRVPVRLEAYDKAFRLGLNVLPEGLLVWGALVLGNQDLGLSEKQSADLTELLARTYTAIGSDPTFARVPSALPYCFATSKHTQGHYFVYRPAALPADPRTLVFLHGYGGNFLFYTWVLKEAFSDHIILAPSWNAGWYRGSPRYLQDMLADAERRLGVTIREPWLFAISAGGRGGFVIYSQLQTVFSGYVCLAAAPEDAVIPQLRSTMNVVMINGTEDRMVPVAVARRQAAAARQRIPSLVMEEMKGDHFFLLSRREETFAIVRRYMEKRTHAPLHQRR
ncbi:MAG: hypothetical protein JXR37_10520 [Kiritimatiellae bacterium]|nr:hypothetical protein [Kiritimatiellia bacterium]